MKGVSDFYQSLERFWKLNFLCANFFSKCEKFLWIENFPVSEFLIENSIGNVRKVRKKFPVKISFCEKIRSPNSKKTILENFLKFLKNIKNVFCYISFFFNRILEKNSFGIFLISIEISLEIDWKLFLFFSNIFSII